MNLESQIEFAQSLFANGERVQKLLADREKARAALEKIDQELAELLPAAPAPTNGRASQKCGNCGQEGHSRRTCPQPPKGGS